MALQAFWRGAISRSVLIARFFLVSRFLTFFEILEIRLPSISGAQSCQTPRTPNPRSKTRSLRKELGPIFAARGASSRNGNGGNVENFERNDTRGLGKVEEGRNAAMCLQRFVKGVWPRSVSRV